MFRLLHFADLHIDTSFAADGLPATVGAWRRADLRATLGRIMTLARERRVDVVTIAGDLYEQNYAVPDTANFLIEQFGRLAPIHVFIAPGKSDPYTDDSLYALMRWPENVTVFSQGQLTTVEMAQNIHLWSAAHPPARGQTVLQKGRLNSEGIHVLLLHATADEPVVSDEVTFSISGSTVREAGFDIALLGGQHNGCLWQDTGARCIYPGSPEPLVASEATGEHQIVFLTIEEGRCTVEQVSISRWRYLSGNVDLTACDSLETATIHVQQAVRGSDHERALWKIRLTGLPDFELDIGSLSESVQAKAHIEYEVHLTLPYNLEQLAQERTVRGLLAQRFQARLSAAQSDQERRKILYALNAALRALDGKREAPHEVE